MYTGMLHTHVTAVLLYLIIFLIKVIYLLADKQDALQKFRAKTKIVGEMVLPTIFLLTGFYLAAKSPYAGQAWFLLKMILLVAALVLGIITFRRNNKALGIITLLIFIYMFALSYTKSIGTSKNDKSPAQNESDVASNPVEHGKSLYISTACTNCHGTDGALGMAGAADLRKSTLNDEEIENTIANGRANMKAYKNELSPTEINDLAAYIKTFRN
jgi:cytochrome c553